MTLFSGAKAELTEVARGLLTLEINTIIKENMTAEPMPAVPHAILDIAGEYGCFLRRCNAVVSSYFKAADPSVVSIGWGNDPGFDTALMSVSSDCFDRLHWCAKAASADADQAPKRIEPHDRVMLERICSNSNKLKEILKRGEAKGVSGVGAQRAGLVASPLDPNATAKLPPEDLIAIRKIWEVGTETVVAQTVIQVDGDVTTRVQDWVLKPEGSPLYAIHRDGIATAMKSWENLVDVVSKIAGTTASSLFKR